MVARLIYGGLKAKSSLHFPNSMQTRFPVCRASISHGGNIDKPPERHPMKYFTLLQNLPEGSIYQTDLTPVVQFQDWLDDFEELLRQSPRFATVCTPMRLDKSAEQRTADRKLYLDWIRAYQPQLDAQCAAMLMVEPDPEIFAELQQQSSKLSVSLNVRYTLARTQDEALQLAAQALKQQFGA